MKHGIIGSYQKGCRCDPCKRSQVNTQANYKMRRFKDLELAKLKSQPCMDCGGTFPPECMDFDHVRGKKLFSIALGWSRKKELVLEEIAKCELVCANCHRIRTKNRANKGA